MARTEDFYFKSPAQHKTNLTITDERVTLKVDQRDDFDTMVRWARQIASQIPVGSNSLRGALRDTGSMALTTGRNNRVVRYQFREGVMQTNG